MSKILNVLTTMDVYGSKINFSIQNSSSIKTLAGGMMSFLTLLFIIFTFIAFGQDFYYMKNPRVLIQHKKHTYDELYALNNATLQNKTIIVMVEKDLDAITDWIVDGNVPYTLQQEKVNYIMKPCDEDFITQEFYGGNKTYALDDIKNRYSYLCYDQSTMRFGLLDSGEGRGSHLVSPLSIWTWKCGDSAFDLKTKECPIDYDESKFVKKTEVQVWGYEMLYDPDNISIPFSDSLTRFAHIQLTKTGMFYVDINIIKHENHDNKGFFMDTDEVLTSYVIDKTQTKFIPLQIPQDFFDITLYIGYSKTYYKYQRTYMKIQDLLAQVGGVIKFIFTLFQVISYLFNEYYLNTYLLSLSKTKIRTDNKKEDEHISIPSFKKQQHKIKSKPINININKSDSKIEISKNPTNNPKVNNFLNKNKEDNLSESITFYEYLKYMLACGSSTVKKNCAYANSLNLLKTYWI